MPKITNTITGQTVDVSPQEATDLERMGVVAKAPAASKSRAKRAPRKKAAAKPATSPSGSQPADTTTGRD